MALGQNFISYQSIKSDAEKADLELITTPSEWFRLVQDKDQILESLNYKSIKYLHVLVKCKESGHITSREVRRISDGCAMCNLKVSKQNLELGREPLTYEHIRDVGLARGFRLLSSPSEVEAAIEESITENGRADRAVLKWEHIAEGCGHILETRFEYIRDRPSCPWCRPTPSGNDAKFGINPQFNLDNLPTILKDFILYESSIGGRLPFDPPSGFERISHFGRKLTSSGKIVKLGGIFNKRYINNFVKRANIKITLTSDILTQNKINDYEDGDYPNAPTNLQLISLAKKYSIHDSCIFQSLFKIDTAIVVELPVFEPATHRLVGHIDLLVQELDGHLVIWDYKPQWSIVKWSPSLNSPQYRSFIQFIPQIASYALTLMHQLGLKDVTCGIFNHEGTWEFDPVRVMKILNSDFTNAPFPWRDFFFLNI